MNITLVEILSEKQSISEVRDKLTTMKKGLEAKGYTVETRIDESLPTKK
jgi:hypothetical protein